MSAGVTSYAKLLGCAVSISITNVLPILYTPQQASNWGVKRLALPNSRPHPRILGSLCAAQEQRVGGREGGRHQVHAPVCVQDIFSLGSFRGRRHGIRQQCWIPIEQMRRFANCRDGFRHVGHDSHRHRPVDVHAPKSACRDIATEYAHGQHQGHGQRRSTRW